MPRIIGDYTGTAFEDFLVLPGLPGEDSMVPDDVTLESYICGIRMTAPFFTAAMRSVTGRELALAAGRAGIMAVAPRGLNIEKEADIVSYVKKHEIEPGCMMSVKDPVTVLDTDTLGAAISRATEYGHSKIPVVTSRADFRGIFNYNPSVHNRMPANTPVYSVMEEFPEDYICNERMTDAKISRIMESGDLRFAPVLDDVGRLSRLVFMQKEEAYKVGAAIDTHPGWEERAEAMLEAGADMIFIDTSDAYKRFARDVVKRYKESHPGGPPICAGNIVTPDAFDYLADAGADAIKVGMGPGSICSTNEVLGVGAPAFWALVEVSRRRDEYHEKKGVYIPVIVDGGIEGTRDITIAMTHADGLMGGKIFGCFEESAGEKIKNDDKKTIAVRIYGEASEEAFRTTGNMDRYDAPLSKTVSSFQGVSGLVPYRGRFKPGLEIYKKTLREALFHAGCENLAEYRDRATLIRLSGAAGVITKPHGVQVVGD